jgi:uncharacterized protein
MEAFNMTDDVVSPEVTSDDKLWALLSYLLTPIVPLIIMFGMPDKKDRPYLRYHYMQALIWGVIGYVLIFVTSFIIIGICVAPLFAVATIYFGVKAYQGAYVTIPVLTNFAKNQGWM